MRHTTADTTTRCAGSDLLVASVNPTLPAMGGRVALLRRHLGMQFCPECDGLVDTTSNFCDVRLVEHVRGEL